jgi:hypothetical protein
VRRCSGPGLQNAPPAPLPRAARLPARPPRRPVPPLRKRPAGPQPRPRDQRALPARARPLPRPVAAAPRPPRPARPQRARGAAIQGPRKRLAARSGRSHAGGDARRSAARRRGRGTRRPCRAGPAGAGLPAPAARRAGLHGRANSQGGAPVEAAAGEGRGPGCWGEPPTGTQSAAASAPTAPAPQRGGVAAGAAARAPWRLSPNQRVSAFYTRRPRAPGRRVGRPQPLLRPWHRRGHAHASKGRPGPPPSRAQQGRARGPGAGGEGSMQVLEAGRARAARWGRGRAATAPRSKRSGPRAACRRAAGSSGQGLGRRGARGRRHAGAPARAGHSSLGAGGAAFRGVKRDTASSTLERTAEYWRSVGGRVGGEERARELWELGRAAGRRRSGAPLGARACHADWVYPGAPALQPSASPACVRAVLRPASTSSLRSSYSLGSVKAASTAGGRGGGVGLGVGQGGVGGTKRGGPG